MQDNIPQSVPKSPFTNIGRPPRPGTSTSIDDRFDSRFRARKTLHECSQKFPRNGETVVETTVLSTTSVLRWTTFSDTYSCTIGMSMH